MNPLFQAAKESMTDEVGLLMGATTLIFMAIFAAWTWWAYAPSRAGVMESYGKIPLDDESDR